MARAPKRDESRLGTPPWIRRVSFSYPPRSGFATRKDMSTLILLEAPTIHKSQIIHHKS